MALEHVMHVQICISHGKGQVLLKVLQEFDFLRSFLVLRAIHTCVPLNAGGKIPRLFAFCLAVLNIWN